MYQAKRNNFPFLFLLVLICLIKLFHIGYYRVHFSPNLLFHTFERDFANNKAVSDIVLEANQLIEKAKIVDFNLSNNLILDDYFNFFPQTNYQSYLQLINKADIILDSLNWSGLNTSIDALNLNKPVITLPSNLMRGRHSYGILKILKMSA